MADIREIEEKVQKDLEEVRYEEFVSFSIKSWDQLCCANCLLSFFVPFLAQFLTVVRKMY